MYQRTIEEICNGCYCLRKAVDLKTHLCTVCHGKPSVVISIDDVVECPCAECIVKAMCKDICSRYTFYKSLATGEITLKFYKQSY